MTPKVLTPTAQARHTPADFDRLTAQALLNAMPFASIVIDDAGTLVAHNAGAEDLLAGQSAGRIGRAVEGPFRVMVDRARRTGMTASFEQAVGAGWYFVAAYPIVIPSQVPLQMISAADITVRKRNEFEIRESEARLEEATRIA